MGFFSTIFHGAENIVSSIYHGVANDINDVGSVIKKVPDVVNNAVDKVTSVGKDAVDQVGGIAKGAEFDLFLPFLLIGGGLAFFLYNQSPNTVSNVAQSASRAPIPIG
jgi:hypothetical protein